MNEEQKAQALALGQIDEVSACATNNMPRVWVDRPGNAPALVLDLADQTGQVEGVLHRVLDRLVGEPVEVQVMKGGTWAARAASAHVCLDGANWTALHPTRLDAIVGALRAWVDGR